MPKAKTHDFKGKVYSEVPDEIVKLLNIKAGDELEFLNVYKDMIVITKPAGTKTEKVETKTEAKKEETKALDADELEVLEKVNSVKYFDRSRENVLKKLENWEIPIFNNLFHKKVLFEYTKKDKKWVGISKEYFQLVIKTPYKKEPSDPMIAKLQKDGYLVLSSEEEARLLNDKLKKERMQNSVKGVRGFDKKFYVVMLERLNQVEGSLIKALEKERVLADIANELKIPKDLCKAAIEVLREDGSVIEKKKEVYVSA